MHEYDVPRRHSFSPIPSARSAQDSQGGPSATPIYDALYTEYVKSFRALPGDRSGEEKLGFTAFGNTPHGSGSYGGGSYGSSYSAYSAGAQSARHAAGQQPQWQRVGTIGSHGTGMHYVPAGLPPGRRGV
ncbi:hypothetical protein ABZ178_34810 [Streptomyces massasporeus]|uniref:hypothetical protein n=1 Tax=Streptomyces massasporeus TaxID=67324 RepID=UPI001672C80D|nr:hypothetical protein [Streptomyces massasporeus]GGV68583.1 hypothetical protein GCM10010228_23210 [Streptomyces massasporeus]